MQQKLEEHQQWIRHKISIDTFLWFLSNKGSTVNHRVAICLI